MGQPLALRALKAVPEHFEYMTWPARAMVGTLYSLVAAGLVGSAAVRLNVFGAKAAASRLVAVQGIQALQQAGDLVGQQPAVALANYALHAVTETPAVQHVVSCASAAVGPIANAAAPAVQAAGQFAVLALTT